MRNSAKVLVVLIIALAMFAMAGCSKQAGPKDEDATKAIQATIESSPKGYALKSPIVILERGKQLVSGDWPIKAEYTAAAKDGTTKKETATYNLGSSINDMGVTIWMATEAK